MNRLKELREDNDLLQKEIAKMIGITQRNYSYFETGKTELTADILIRVSKIYKVSIDYILYQTDNRTPYPKSIVDFEKDKENEN